MPFVDLHIHSHYSDGIDSPAGIVQRAAALGFAAIALTDHDSIAGVAEAAAVAREALIEFMPGTEMSASYGQIEVHIVGLGIDPDDEDLADALLKLRKDRSVRTDEFIKRLNEAGIPIARAELQELAGDGDGGAVDEDGTVGRMHLARALHARGLTRTVQDAFNKFLKKGRKTFVPKKNITCARAIELIHGAGGVAIVGHPGVGATVGKILPRLLQFPFDGIEVFHSKHTPGQADQFMQFAREHNLLVSGGSDCHGAASRNAEMGKVRVPYEYYEAIKERLREKARRNP